MKKETRWKIVGIVFAIFCMISFSIASYNLITHHQKSVDIIIESYHPDNLFVNCEESNESYCYFCDEYEGN